MTLLVEVHYALSRDDGKAVPRPRTFRRWVQAALGHRPGPAEISVRLVGLRESAKLNGRFRHRSGPTNVLSFPAQGLPGGPAVPPLGDIVICAPLVASEARSQGKRPMAHWAHLAVHGTLHLLGYDHERAAEAKEMERLEREALSGLGYPDPYARPGSARAASR